MTRAADRLAELCAESGWTLERLQSNSRQYEYVELRRLLCRALYVEGCPVCEISRAMGISRYLARYYLFGRKDRLRAKAR